ncbi:hypothetical protein A2814_00215 [Candidatus Nomurabacteria bacterium RIFCSPHIGHO2_01_FULL_38_19]|uniref:Uncharacterized protein n=1 Tax=Candidatus Nomurabacteria bacterium RIFCSPHIGHO2_01_FULL_38_19 TaxID=1801732 RepID=A0A1F6UQV4_9BACT|nr:MAG: hypothetical protein A2814_00215 [Candidatus Nomurabacteria bacterium RIFCSPHIGHO2_01_FULL_38_19]
MERLNKTEAEIEKELDEARKRAQGFEERLRALETGNETLAERDSSQFIRPEGDERPHLTPTVFEDEETEEEPAPAPRTLTPEEKYLEEQLRLAREGYATEYKNFMMNQRTKFSRAVMFITGGTAPDSAIPKKLQNLELEYDKAAVALGQEMYRAKQSEYSYLSLSLEDREIELSRYKQTEIFKRVIIQEQEELNKLKTENLPPKEKNILKKGLDWYLQLGRGKKILMAFVLSGAFALAVTPGAVAAAGGGVTWFGIKVTRTIAGVGGGQGAGKAIDLLIKDKSGEKREIAENELARMFGGDDVASIRKQFASILEQEQKAKRNRLIGKALAGLVVGGAASLGTGYGVGKLFSGTVPDQVSTSGGKIVPPEPGAKVAPLDTSAPASGASPSGPDTTPPATAGKTAEELAAEVMPAPEAKASAPLIDTTVHRGEGVEHAFIRQIEHNPKLAQELGFKGKLDDAKALHAFAQHEAHVIALKTGYVDNAGNEVRVRVADKASYEIKTDSQGNVTGVEEKLDGKLVDGKGINKEYEYQYKGNQEMPPKAEVAEHVTEAKTLAQTETTVGGKVIEQSTAETLGQQSSAFKNTLPQEPTPAPKTIEEAKSNALKAYEKAKAHAIDEPVEHKTESYDEFKNRTTTTSQSSSEILQKHPGFAKNYFKLPVEKLAAAAQVYESNVQHMASIPGHEYEWGLVKNLPINRDGRFSDIVNNYNEESPVGKLLHRAYEVTGLKPNSGFIFSKKQSVEQWLIKMLQKAAEKGTLDQVKF